MTSVAIIPARGGSKRIPRKNIKHFNGKPMLAWSIECALASKLFDQVIVSTDDDEIAHIARTYGANVPFMRPSSLSDDHTGTGPVMVHAIEFLKNTQLTAQTHSSTASPTAVDEMMVTCIYATAPLLQPEYLHRAQQMLHSDPALDFVFSGCRFRFPIQRGLWRHRNGTTEPVDTASIAKRSQDLPPAFHDAGQFYMGPARSWLSGKPMFSPTSALLELPHFVVQDIDEPDDWLRAEALHQYLYQLQSSRG